jgi:hypothetical protein
VVPILSESGSISDDFNSESIQINIPENKSFPKAPYWLVVQDWKVFFFFFF